jgi:hypothetical protein
VDVFLDTNGNGLHDEYDPEVGGSPLPLPDSDGDGIPDFLDNVHNDGVQEDNGSNCAVVGNGSGKGGLAGLLLVYTLIPAGVLIRRRMRR